MLRGFGTLALCVALIVSIGPSAEPGVASNIYNRLQTSYGSTFRFPPDEGNLDIGPGPDGLLQQLGRQLFFDPRLSGTGRTACATCHDPRYAYADPHRVSLSDNGRIGRRNSPSLVDVGFRPTLMWDGRFSLLEQQAFGPFESGEMGIGIDGGLRYVNSDPQYIELFRAATGHVPTPDGVVRALAVFQRTLVSRETRVDRFLMSYGAAQMTAQELHGYEIFTRRAPCAQCHQLFPSQHDGRKFRKPLFSDFQFHNIGIGTRYGETDDAGRYESSRSKTDWGAFRTPPLRNSVKAPPYMHNGSLATLEDVVEFYNAGGKPNPNLAPLIRPLGLDGQEKAALVAFLRALGE